MNFQRIPWRRILAAGLLAAALVAPVLWTRQSVFSGVFIHVCDLVFERHYEMNDDLKDWHVRCQRAARGALWSLTRQSLLREMRAQLLDLHVSHLDVFDPNEERRIWAGVDLDTGLRVRDIEGHMIVIDVLPRSPAARAGLRVGDEIVAVDGHLQPGRARIERSGGVFTVRRGSETLPMRLTAETLHVDGDPSLSDLGGGHGRLRISSFREEYFEREAWIALAKRFQGFTHLVVDVRENWGGNFVAMLRALSVFTCGRRIVGSLEQPRRTVNKAGMLNDDLNQDRQLAALDELSEIVLETFSGYPCYDGPVTVLMDSGTASVSEIFAFGMSQRERTKLLGTATAGDVVLAVWYHLPKLGPGYSLSIPEAVFITTEDEVLEGKGLWPTEAVSYDLEEARRGVDSFVARAISGGRRP